jgi:hypothetical protein
MNVIWPTAETEKPTLKSVDTVTETAATVTKEWIERKIQGCDAVSTGDERRR